MLPQHYGCFATPGVEEAHKYHCQTMHNCLRAVMEQLLAVQLAIPEGLKPRRSDPSKMITPYAGSAKFSKLEDWLMSICIFYTVAQYGGDGCNHEKVPILMDFLAAGALKWYLQHVIHVNRAQFYWRLENVMLGLQRRGFYDALLDHAQNMAMFPNKSTVCEWFLEGILSDMLIALICNGGLAPKVNTAEEFVLEAKAYKSSIKTAAHYLECRKNVVAITSGQPSRDARQSAKCYKCRKTGHFACECREPAKPAPRVFVQAAHTAVQLDVGEADDEQKEEPAKADTDEAFQSNGTQEHGEEYVDLETYNNKYYTCGSNSEGLFALTEVPFGEQREKEPGNEVCIRKVLLVASKDAMECPVLLAQDKECLVTWTEVNGHKAWMLWNFESTTSGIMLSFVHVVRIWVAPLATPITLQLGTVGSGSIVNYSARVTLKVPGEIHDIYVDVVNFDCYDMSMGTPFMRTHKVLLDFVND
ncbi:hypothetical protein C0989_005778 [Termitomyces sp. Mn162]|nr:hypothetical protein C0989_005778 [Termitomyces sp. Mn162]